MTPTSSTDSVRSAWTHRTSRPFTVVGTIGVVGGGLLSAITAGNPNYYASWAVAYVVLVVGVAQITLGVAQTTLTGGTVRGRVVAAQVICWNLGNAFVLFATLAGVPMLLYVGIAFLVAALALFAIAIRQGSRGLVFTVAWALIVILAVSLPVGAIIQAVRR